MSQSEPLDHTALSYFGTLPGSKLLVRRDEDADGVPALHVAKSEVWEKPAWWECRKKKIWNRAAPQTESTKTLSKKDKKQQEQKRKETASAARAQELKNDFSWRQNPPMLQGDATWGCLDASFSVFGTFAESQAEQKPAAIDPEVERRKKLGLPKEATEEECLTAEKKEEAEEAKKKETKEGKEMKNEWVENQQFKRKKELKELEGGGSDQGAGQPTITKSKKFDPRWRSKVLMGYKKFGEDEGKDLPISYQDATKRIKAADWDLRQLGNKRPIQWPEYIPPNSEVVFACSASESWRSKGLRFWLSYVS